MKKQTNYTLIGVGHRARQGKDTTANFIRQHRENVHILHFADALYDEVRNVNRKIPLIRRLPITEFNVWQPAFAVCSNITHGTMGPVVNNEEIISSVELSNKIDTLFTERGIDTYWGMDEKDAPMLQLWGTNFRRQLCDKDYWVKQTMKKVDEIINTPTEYSKGYIIIADTRFVNEVDAIRAHGGFYARVVRQNDDGTQYIDPTRDPNHPSEIDVLNVVPDYNLVASDGDLHGLEQEVLSLLFLLEVDKVA